MTCPQEPAGREIAKASSADLHVVAEHYARLPQWIEDEGARLTDEERVGYASTAERVRRLREAMLEAESSDGLRDAIAQLQRQLKAAESPSARAVVIVARALLSLIPSLAP